MRFNQIITVVFLALSFCVFDQIKDNVIERISAPEENHAILMSSVEQLEKMIPQGFEGNCLIDAEEGCSKTTKDMILVDLGKRVYNAIVLSAL